MIHLMNSALIPHEGRYECRKISQSYFFDTLRKYDFISHVGYPQNARIISDRIGKPVAISRLDTKLQDRDTMLVMKLAYRPQNKKNLNPSIEDFEFFEIEYRA